jgi:hypothetical protein
MKKESFTWFIWIPRILGILMGCFLFLFSFDSFEGDSSIWLKIAGFLIHNIPTALLLLMIILLWKQPFWAGLVIIFLGIMFTGYLKTYERFDTFMLISFPVLLTGILFIWASFRKKSPARKEPTDMGEAGNP